MRKFLSILKRNISMFFLKALISKTKALCSSAKSLKLFNGSSPKVKLKAGDKIPDKEYLLRRVYFQDKRHVRPDGTLSSRAFAPRPKDNGKLSVDLEPLIVSLAISISDISKFRLYKIQAELPHSIGLKCIYDPWTKEIQGTDNPAHSFISEFEESDEAKPGILAKNAVKVSYPN